ncbi:hypothetical protein GMB51_11795 [Turicibacter sanguinis]|nr:hypothetical protein [Turicibacter sanguinis]MTN51675.1 hypothetical protein [Turicibacter sanguinis]MTN53524.1 hypothetical protein [Turicibacter sanguinis]MTN57927.1 hypothetical protein [Turicibacter sanguinis]MTN61027.1 hypothetical protein [Turicibacter sanguinis]
MDENKMYGYFVNGCLNISVTNMEEFNLLLERAKKEARQLNKTISELELFELKIEFSTDKK